MAFIRVKTIRGRDYAYLVESRWDPARKTSRQGVVRYLGPADGVRLEDVPAEHRNPGVEAFVLQHSKNAEARRERVSSGLVDRLVRALLEGDRGGAEAVSREAVDVLGLEPFHTEIVRNAMYKVGDLWESAEISISQEHLASNTMAHALDIINAEVPAWARTRGAVALCTPMGEQHNLSTKVLEGLLANRGYRPFNISASAPTDAIVDFVVDRRPVAVFVSVTIPEYLPNAKRLVKALRGRAPRIRVLVGGQALREDTDGAFPPGSVVPPERTLAAIDALRAGVRHQRPTDA